MVQEWGLAPIAVMGYSVGEMAAGCIAGIITAADVCQQFG